MRGGPGGVAGRGVSGVWVGRVLSRGARRLVRVDFGVGWRSLVPVA
jgi:hypothetical protein